MTRKLQICSALVLGLLLAGCVQQVNIEDYIASQSSGNLVVEGLITNEKTLHKIKLSRPGKAIPTEPYEPVSGAEVFISDGTLTHTLTEQNPGVYITDSIHGEVNKTYTLTVIVNGVLYEATDTMLPVSSFGRPDGFVMGSRTPPRGYIQSPVIVFGSDAPAMLNITIDNPKPNDKYTELNYFTFPGVDPDHLLPKYVEASLPYDEGTQVTQAKYSLSQEHYLFLRAMLLETEYRGGIFGSVRANVPTNISGGAYGFFGACEKITRTGIVGNDGQLH
jgi:hypothetical protein